MKKQKITIIGSDINASFMASSFYAYLENYPDYEITWYQTNPNVLESNFVTLEVLTIQYLASIFGLTSSFIEKTDAQLIYGNEYIGWDKNKEYTNYNILGNFYLNVDFKKFKKFISSKIKSKIKIINQGQIDLEEIKDSFIINFSLDANLNPPKTKSNFFPVNCFYETYCEGDFSKNFTNKKIARPYGWVELFYLKDKCVIRYFYNKHLNKSKEIKNDLKSIKKQYNLPKFQDIIRIPFDNFYAKNPLTLNTIHGGSTGIFLDPLVSNPVNLSFILMSFYIEFINTPLKPKAIPNYNSLFQLIIRDIHRITNLMYFSNNNFNTPFWNNAKSISKKGLDITLKDGKFKTLISNLKLSIARNHFRMRDNIPLYHIGYNEYVTHYKEMDFEKTIKLLTE